MARPTHVLVSRKGAVSAALKLIDRGGLESLTIRSLAGALSVTSAALYHHFNDKDEILDGVVRLILGAVTDPDPSLPWTEQVQDQCVRYRRAIMAHPRAALLLIGHPYRRFATHSLETIALAMADAGVAAALIPVIAQCTEAYTYGSALNDSAIVDVPVPPDLPALYAHPEVRASLTLPLDRDSIFLVGLEALLAGFVIDQSDPRPARTP